MVRSKTGDPGGGRHGSDSIEHSWWAMGHPVKHPRRPGIEPGGPELWIDGQERRARITPGHVLLRRKVNQLLCAKHGIFDCALISSLYPIHHMQTPLRSAPGRPGRRDEETFLGRSATGPWSLGGRAEM